MEERSTNPATDIRYLAEVPACIPELLALFIEEWSPYYGPGGPGDAEADLRSCLNRDRVPLALVAIESDGAVLGTGALKADSVGSEPGEEPWIAALVVVPEYRRRGVGRALMAALIDEARRLGIASVYISTDASDRLLRGRDWREIRSGPSLRGPIGVFRLDFA